MGIQGLIPFLEKASRPINISEFSGATVAIDAYCWLHKGAFSCAEKLARGEKCDAYVHYCMKFITMLLSHNIKPILVFDGRHLPAKAETEKKRKENREINRRRAAELLRQDKPDQAKTYIRRCVDITHEMALEVIQKCRSYNVDCITAPYEADAQLAYLNITGIAHLVITEDSDLILFGCKKVVFKMDVYGGGLLVEQERLHLAMKIRPENYSFEKFRRMCILSGCDYLPSLPGIGLSKACKFISRTSDPDIHRALTRMASYLNMPSLPVTKEYRDNVLHAEAMFKHQPVFDPITRKVVPLTPIESDSPPLMLPPPLPDNQAYQLALGNLEPFTLERVCNWDPDNRGPSMNKNWGRVWCNHASIWSPDYVTKPQPPPRNKKPQFPPSTYGMHRVVKTDDISRVSPQIVGDLEVESLLMEFDGVDGTPRSPPAKRICNQDNSSPYDSKTDGTSSGQCSPDLSAKNKQNKNRMNIFRKNTSIDEKSVVFSRYFFTPDNSSEELKTEPEDSPSFNESCDLVQEKDEKLKDLSNLLNSEKVKTDVKLSPKKNCSQSDLENIFVISPEKASGCVDLPKFKNESVSFNISQNSFSGESEPSSQTSYKSSNSLFKWKKQLHEKFGYSKAKIKGSNSVNSDELLSQNEISFNDCSFNSESEEKYSNSESYTSVSLVDDVDHVVNKLQKSVENKKTYNPFKINSAATKTSPNFSLLRDPVPDVYSQDIDESFVKQCDTPTIKKTSPNLKTSQTKLNNSATKVKNNATKLNSTMNKSRSVGLSKKSLPAKPAQKSLLSMFMLQPKPKVQC